MNLYFQDGNTISQKENRMNKKISIIIPCYNVENTIVKCLDSLVNQTIGIDAMELILIDDASTDETLNILCQYEQQFSESILVVHCNDNGKPGQARNVGLQYASGEYIGFVDADDYCEPQMYDTMYHAAISQGCDLVICQYTQNEIDNQLPTNFISSTTMSIDTVEDRLHFLNLTTFHPIWNRLYTKELLVDNAIAFPAGMYYEDVFFSGLINGYCKKVCILPDTLYHHVLHYNSITCKLTPETLLNRLETNMMLIEELRNRNLYQPFAVWYDNHFITEYTLFVTTFTKQFGKIHSELFDVLQQSIYELFPYIARIPQIQLFSHENADLNLRMAVRPLIEHAPKTVTRILVVKGRSRYDVLRDFADELITGFQNMGIIVDIYDVADSEHRCTQDEFCKMQIYDAIVSFNGMMTNLLDLFDKHAKPLFLSFLVDHPYYHHPRMESANENHCVSCVDHHHVKYIEKYYPNVKDTCFIAHGGNHPVTPVKPYKERSYSVVFMGSYGDIATEEQEINEFPELAKTIAWNVINQHRANRHKPLEMLFQKEFEKYQLDISKEEFRNLLYQMAIVDKYIRLQNRKSIIDTLTQNGVHVDVFGANWETYSCDSPDLIHIHGQVSYSTILETMCDTKIVLNALPLFMNGSHERVFTSMLCGAVCLTERNEYLEGLFHDGAELRFFDMDDLGKLPCIIEEILSDSEKAEQIALTGQRKAREHHTWMHRAEDIIKFIQQHL